MQPTDPPELLARHHVDIWWLHDAADYTRLELTARVLVSLVFPDLHPTSQRHCGLAIQEAYVAYDQAQTCIREWRFDNYPLAMERLRNAHTHAREAWAPEAPTGMEEGYYAFFAHSMWLHAPGWRRPLQKLWRNPARLAGIHRYHRASFGHSHPHAVAPAVRALFWAGLSGHDYKSRASAERWLTIYWAGLQAAGIRHLFF